MKNCLLTAELCVEHISITFQLNEIAKIPDNVIELPAYVHFCEMLITQHPEIQSVQKEIQKSNINCKSLILI